MTGMLKPADVAASLDLSTRTIMRAIHAGELRASQLARGRWRIHPDDVAAWIELRANRPREQTPGTARPVTQLRRDAATSKRRAAEPPRGTLRVPPIDHAA